jgi:glycosyltransferase involved in cell wall biosynthesis
VGILQNPRENARTVSNNKKYYQKYTEEVEEACKYNNVLLTGFVEERHIPLYFQAADLVIFPYRTFMSASGPLSFALSFEKPFLVSEALQEVFTTKDMLDVLTEEHLTINDFVFPPYGTNLGEKIQRCMHDKKYRQTLIAFAKAIKHKRNWDTIGEMYYHEIFE